MQPADPGAGLRDAVAALLVLVAVTGCGDAETFAQHPGFERWFDTHPPDPRSATDHERALLHRYRPRLFVPRSAPGPLDFYADYIGHGTLRAGDRRWRDVDRARLDAHASDPEAVFVHDPPAGAEPSPVAFGRVDHSTLPPFGRLTFLTWHFVFRHSGLPAELPTWQAWLATALADPADWHQLDHYTAATLVLGPGETPLGLVLQQHNWVHAYWFGRDLTLPTDGRVRLAAALRSNELYPWRGGRRRHRTVRFLEAENLEWLATGTGDAPWTAAHDVTVPGRAVAYALAFPAQTDPFYRFKGRLGADRLLPGRDGPPGADYNTIPAFKDRVLQFCAFRWRADMGDARLARLRSLLADPHDPQARTALKDSCRDFVGTRLGLPPDTKSSRRTMGYNARAAAPGREAR